MNQIGPDKTTIRSYAVMSQMVVISVVLMKAEKNSSVGQSATTGLVCLIIKLVIIERLNLGYRKRLD